MEKGIQLNDKTKMVAWEIIMSAPTYSQLFIWKSMSYSYRYFNNLI